MWAQPPKIAGGVTPWFWILAERNEETPIRTVNRRSVQRQRTQDITERLDQRCAGVCEPRVCDALKWSGWPEATEKLLN